MFDLPSIQPLLRLLSTALLLATVVGCGSSTGQSSTTPANGRLIAFDELVIKQPEVRRRVRRFEAAAQDVAKPGWHHIPWQWYETNSRPDYGVHTRWRNAEGAASHELALYGSDPADLRTFGLAAGIHPPACQWDLHISYSENWSEGRMVQEHFSVIFDDRKLRPTASQPILTLPCTTFGVQEKFGQIEYGVAVQIDERERALNSALAYLTSAEEFQATALAAYDQLELLIREQIDSGERLVAYDYSRMVEPPQTTSIPVPMVPVPTKIDSPLPEVHLPTAEQKEQLLVKALADLESQRQFVRKHGSELFAAMEKVFPLGKVLSELEPTNRAP